MFFNIVLVCNNFVMEFECYNKVYCIDKDYVCDGLLDCVDNSDEIFVVCKFLCFNFNIFFNLLLYNMY